MCGEGVHEGLSRSIEDYLKAIYMLNQREGRASTNAIAEQMGVAPASVTNMIQRLAEMHPPLVDYQKHQGVILTPDGERAALETVRNHRLIEMFLMQILGYTWDEVHPEADRLEHVVSSHFTERIASVLGNPRRDPHGDPIPDEDLHMPGLAAKSLYELRPGQEAIVQRVSDQDPGLLRFLSESGIVPNVCLKILDYTPYDETLRVQVEGQPGPLVLGPGISRRVFVEVS